MKFGYVRKPMVVETYICIFVCLAVKDIHLELISDLLLTDSLLLFAALSQGKAVHVSS